MSDKMSREARRVLAAASPPSSPTRIPVAPAAASAKSQPSPKELQEQICAEYRAKYGHEPTLDHVLAEVWRRHGFSTMSARQKKQFPEPKR